MADSEAQRGHTEPGKRVTSTDVAAAAGVSQATVSRVLSGSPLVKASTRDAVLRALHESGFTPHAGARAMRTQRTGIVGVVVANVTNPFYPHLLEALSAAIHAQGLRMIMWDGRMGGERSAVTAIREGAIDSIIFTTATARSAPLHEAVARGLPIVLVNRVVRGLACDVVTADNAAGGRTVADYFATGGRSTAAVVRGLRGVSTNMERVDGFRSALSRLGPEKPRHSTFGPFTYEHGFNAMQDLLSHGPPPGAVFCTNDVLAFGALDAARAAGLRVPEDIWVVGYDDIEMSSWRAYDLTTVRQPVRLMAQQAIVYAVERLESPGRPVQRALLSSELVVRGSTANASPKPL